MKYHFRIHGSSKKGFWAEGVELQGCQSQGDTLEELYCNLQEALDLYLSEPEDSQMLFPEPQKNLNGKDFVAVVVSPTVAVACKIRSIRLKRNLTQRQMCDALGITHLSAYQRLEDPERANPELKTLAKLKSAFPELKLDEVI
ncbi:type II toxin-antitoxin system HicB family antitoxin [Bdellovibrio bacteriovorus]|uniref:HicB family protein n=1 Tax=Bdellovibrio bacteriovorus TaxID=959 RepID=A0A1Z3NCG2_BDEBC|nr:type II toxin-antitoxin system HicB family antitoxin [Bdellovibrio bacteriovorus]ASD65164.1 HicB family protein [Bdellovibrio bacteriovorus]